MTDSEIVENVWNGKIYAKFSLSGTSFRGESEPYYCFLNRISYFFSYTKKLCQFFENYIGQEFFNELWFEYEGQMVKWQYPIGLLFDIMVKDKNQPWHLIIHFDKFPENTLIRFDDNTLKSQFISSLKEADYLKHELQSISSLKPGETDSLYIAFMDSDIAKYKDIKEKLNTKPYKRLPIKIYNNTAKPSRFEYYPKENDTVQDLLIAFRGPSATDNDNFLRFSQVWLHGVKIPIESNLLWLYDCMAYPDNFLHLYVES